MIVDLLKTGKENATDSQTLADLAGCKSVRELQQVIALERAAGEVILSSTQGGYYLPANEQEVREFCRTLEARSRNTLLALKSAKIALQKGFE